MINLSLSTLVTFNYNRCCVLWSCFLAFYVSFVVTPLCSNASELVSSLIFAAKKKKENISMTFAQVMFLSEIREVKKNQVDTQKPANFMRSLQVWSWLITVNYIPISMFKHPVPCLHVTGLQWPAVCKSIATGLCCKKYTRFTPVLQFASILILGTWSQHWWQLSAKEKKQCLLN